MPILLNLINIHFTFVTNGYFFIVARYHFIRSVCPKQDICSRLVFAPFGTNIFIRLTHHKLDLYSTLQQSETMLLFRNLMHEVIEALSSQFRKVFGNKSCEVQMLWRWQPDVRQIHHCCRTRKKWCSCPNLNGKRVLTLFLFGEKLCFFRFRFERSYQPNVALVPPVPKKHRYGRSHLNASSDINQQCSSSTSTRPDEVLPAIKSEPIAQSPLTNGHAIKVSHF